MPRRPRPIGDAPLHRYAQEHQDRLESEGLVRREPCSEDRRGAYAILREAGLDRLAEAHPTHLAGVHKLFLEHFAEEELKTMAEYRRRVLGGA